MSKQQVYFYKLYLFSSNKEDASDFIELSQEKGQRLAMALASDNCPKYILIDDDIINTSAIESLERVDKIHFTHSETFRELTPSELETQKKFEAFKGEAYKLKTGK